MQLPLIDRIRSFIQAEAVLVVAALAALLSACLFPPTPQNWSAYAEAIDWRTIGLLFCLMTVVAGFTRAGLLARVRSLLTRTEGTQRRLSLLLVTLSFFTAMIVTNDVALISFATPHPVALPWLRTPLDRSSHSSHKPSRQISAR